MDIAIQASLPLSAPCTSMLMQGHNTDVCNVVFSPDGRQLATGSYDSTTKIWDLASGLCTMLLEVEGSEGGEVHNNLNMPHDQVCTS